MLTNKSHILTSYLNEKCTISFLKIKLASFIVDIRLSQFYKKSQVKYTENYIYFHATESLYEIRKNNLIL